MPIRFIQFYFHAVETGYFLKRSTQIFKSVGSQITTRKKSLWEDTKPSLRNARLNLEKRDDKPAAIFFCTSGRARATQASVLD